MDVSSPRPLRRAEGIQLHRTVVPPDETSLREGLRVTSVPRTLLDLAGVVDTHRLRRAAEQAEILRLTDELSLDELLHRHPGRAGAAAVRALLEDGLADLGQTRSELEERFLAFLDARALPRPRVNAQVEGLEVDFAWPGPRVVVELDGHAFHGHREAFERDRRRDRALQAAGWRVVRITWRQLRGDPDGLAADLRRLLASV